MSSISTISETPATGPRVARAPFRPDIQGLRAIAVLLVVVFHTGALGLEGGYIGVDVFFVISGFLITNHLLSQIERDGSLNFGQFYARRVRRILPASFVVLLLTLIASAIYMPPALRPATLWDAIWTALYVPNVALAIEGTEYLAETAPSPFQHYWSLGVEEQFYLFWPLALLAIWALTSRSRRATGIIVGVLVLLSFAVGWWLTYRSQPWAFFSLPTRAWELGIGAFIAILGPELARRIPAPMRATVAWLGIGAVVAAALFFDATTAFPGGAAAVPVLGTAAVIFLLQEPTPYSPNRLLSTRPMVFIGGISYSLYLVHWPLQVIPAAAAGRPLEPAVAIGLGIVAVPIAWALYKFVETPARRGGRLGSSRPRWSLLLALGASVMSVVIALGAMSVAGSAPLHSGRPAESVLAMDPPATFTDFVPSNLTPSLEEVSADVPVIYADGCHLAVPDQQVQACSYGDVNSENVIALFGDSHAAQWFPALERLATEHGYRLDSYTKSSCPSVDVAITVKGVPYAECVTWRDAVIERLNEDAPNLVVLSNMANQPDQPNGGIDPQAWANGLGGVIDRLPQSQVAVITDTPNLKATPAICLSANLHSARNCDVPRELALDPGWAVPEAQAATDAGALVVDLNDSLCDPDMCGMIRGATLLYRDAHHLTAQAARQLAAPLWNHLEPTLAADSVG